MTSSLGRFAVFLVVHVTVATNCAALPQESRDPRTQVRSLAARGNLDEAEKVARAGGANTLVALGDVLTMRGRLTAADSAYRRAIADRAPDRFDAEIALAELADRRGDRADATQRARAIVDEYDRANRPVGMHMAAGRAWVLLGTGNAEAPRRALAAFDLAASAHQVDPEPLLRVGDLFLDRYNAPDARTSYQAALTRAPDDARAMLGLARVDEFEGKPQSIEGVRKALKTNASLVAAQVVLSRMHLEAESYDSANHWARRAISVDSSSMGAWSLLGASAWLRGDSATFRTARDAATRLQPRPADFYTELAEAAVRQRRYTDAVQLAQRAVSFDSASVRALGVLGTNQLRTGDMQGGKASLDRAFALDAYNLWHKNTLDLLDKVNGFQTIDRGRFKVVAAKKEAELLALYIVPLLEKAYDSLSVRYAYKPPTPVRLEFYDDHRDFSVRTVGLMGLGALGVSFGNVLAMDTPSARDMGTFNWGSTAWHELMHAFSLGASGHRVPRWFSEGLSVLEERRAIPGWGADVSIPFIAAYSGKMLRPISRLNEGFLYPRNAAEVSFSYYLASLFCEMVEEKHGTRALTAMLTAWRDGADTPEVFQRALKLTPEQVDAQFEAWMKAKFAAPLRSVAALSSEPKEGEQIGGQFIEAMRAASALVAAGQKAEAIAALERAQALFPEYAGDDSPALMLARLYNEQGNSAKALEQLSRVTLRNETAYDANKLEVDLRSKMADTVGAMAALDRMIWMTPYDVPVHARLAELAAAKKNHALAVRERRAIVALDPADPLDARYELARALIAAGDNTGARRELLDILERAPSFEKAQLLLLDLRGRDSGRSTR
jgi:cellulose synthase operon protein C